MSRFGGNVMLALRAATAALCCLMSMQTLAATGCPPGEIPGSVDKDAHVLTCTKPKGEIDCGGGRSCPAGLTCAPGGGCAGATGTGPVCGRNGLRCRAGHLCNGATGACYDPTTQYPCGLATCGINLHYPPGHVCAPCQAARHKVERRLARHRH